LISFRRAGTISGYSVSVTLRLPAILGWSLLLGTWVKVGRAGSPGNRGKAVGGRQVPRNCRAAVPLVSAMKFARSGKNSFAWLDFVARNRPKRDSSLRPE